MWIAGTLCEVCYPFQQWSVLLLIPAVVVLACSLRRGEAPCELRLATPKIMGVVLACLTVFLAIQSTALAEQRLDDPGHTQPSQWKQAARAVQERVVERLGELRLSADEHAVLASLTVNERSAMTRELRQRFSAVGVAHLLAVSGFHVALVSGALALLLSLLPRTAPFRILRCGLMIVVAWGYAAVSGLSAPAVRAATMLTIYLIGVAIRRNPEPYNMLAATALLMLVGDPLRLFDVGFQLSFAAVFFILLLAPRITRLIDVHHPLIAPPWRLVAISLAAQIGTFPLCCYYFGRASLVFLFSNFFLSLVATLLIPAALVWVALPAGTPGLSVLQIAVERLTHILVAVVDRFSRLPWASVSVRFDLVQLIGVYVVLFFALRVVISRSRRSLFVSLGGVLALMVYAVVRQFVG